MRKTKIVATIGPSTWDYDVFKKLVKAGLDVVRINFSHATEESSNKILKSVIKARKEFGVPLPIMIDTRGPELRITKFKDGKIFIKKGQEFVFTSRKILGDSTIVGLNMPSLVSSVNIGDKILANDGLLTFKVLKLEKDKVITKALDSGELSNNKSLFIPNVKLSTPYLNAADKKDILWGIKNNTELISISFVNTAKDVQDVRNFITQNGGNMKIISKIESACGVANLDEILAVSDGIMVARGDLGVELQIEKLPAIQKKMIEKANIVGKPIITATEMLESMIHNNRPTRAEVSDVANAVYDGTSAIMLSGETASGDYPVEAVTTMAKIAKETEQNIDWLERFEGFKGKINGSADTISRSAVEATYLQGMKNILVFTTTGETASLVSRYKPTADILAAATDEHTYRQLALLWGVNPAIASIYNDEIELNKITNSLLKTKAKAKKKEKVVVISGEPKIHGGTSVIRIHEVK